MADKRRTVNLKLFQYFVIADYVVFPGNNIRYFSAPRRKVSKGNLVVTHSVPHASSEFQDIVCWVVELNAAL